MTCKFGQLNSPKYLRPHLFTSSYDGDKKAFGHAVT